MLQGPYQHLKPTWICIRAIDISVIGRSGCENFRESIRGYQVESRNTLPMNFCIVLNSAEVSKGDV